jgi:uncharacterized membrane protein
VLSGLLLAMPLVITFWILFQLYSILRSAILDPIAQLVTRLVASGHGGAPPAWWMQWVAPFVAIGLIILILYIVGYFVRTKVAWAVDWVMLRVPGVTFIYETIREVFLSLEKQTQSKQPQRVVLVPFPHPGAKALALVTRRLSDSTTGRAILCVYVMTSVVPPAGFILFVPETDVVDLNWQTKEMFQVILSGGLSTPEHLPFDSNHTD